MQNQISQNDKQRLVNGLRKAATSQLDWQWFLDDFYQVSGGAKVFLASIDMVNKTPINMLYMGFGPEYIDSFRNYYARLNPRLERLNSIPLSQPFSNRELTPDAALKKTEFYNDWIRPQEDAIGGAVASLAQDTARRFVIGGAIRETDREDLEPRFLNLLEFLIPHFHEALEINKMLCGLTLKYHIAREAMNPDSAACFIISPDQKLAYANTHAEAMIAEGTTVQCNPRSHLSLTNNRANQKLASALFGYTNSDMLYSPPFFSGKEKTKPNYICRLVKLDNKDPLPIPYPFDNSSLNFYMLIMSRRS